MASARHCCQLGSVSSTTGSLIISSAFSSAADTLCSTLLGVRSRSGVAVSSITPLGRKRASMSNASSVRLLCASSTTTKGRRRRNTLASEQGVVRSAPSPSLNKPSRWVGDRLSKWCISAPLLWYTLRDSSCST